jgi:AhpD family alkylhydroperoxidase
MEQRMNFYEKGQGALKAMYALNTYLLKSPVEKSLLNLLYQRVSQLNGCAYCIDMHAKDLRAAGETEQRIYLLDAWRETALYSDRERAALAWAEVVTSLPGRQVPDDVYADARKQFSEEELVDLTMAVTAVNTYNRINIAFKVQGGSYQAGQHDK